MPSPRQSPLWCLCALSKFQKSFLETQHTVFIAYSNASRTATASGDRCNDSEAFLKVSTFFSLKSAVLNSVTVLKCHLLEVITIVLGFSRLRTNTAIVDSLATRTSALCIYGATLFTSTIAVAAGEGRLTLCAISTEDGMDWNIAGSSFFFTLYRQNPV